MQQFHVGLAGTCLRSSSSEALVQRMYSGLSVRLLWVGHCTEDLPRSMVTSGYYEKAKPRGVSESDEHSADGETVPPLSIRDEQIIGLAMKVGEYSPKCVEEMIDLT
jgi:hypothetical protein